MNVYIDRAAGVVRREDDHSAVLDLPATSGGVDLTGYVQRWVSHAPHRRGEGTTARERRRGALERLSKRQRAATPNEFRDLLLSIARSHNHET